MGRQAQADAKIEKARLALIENPDIKVKEFAVQSGLAYSTAGRSLKIARKAIQEEQRALVQTNEILGEHKEVLEVRRKEAAVLALTNQLERSNEHNQIIQALREATFNLDKDGKIVGIKPVVKGYNKDGDKIYLTTNAVVGEYLANIKAITDQERLVTGLGLAEQQAIAASKAEATPQVNVILPVPNDTPIRVLSPEDKARRAKTPKD